MKIDPRSAKTALYYTGTDAGEPSISGVPARDLSENDLARLVYIQHGDISGAAHEKSAEAIVDRLTAGPYRKTKPSDEAGPPAKTEEPK